MKLTEAEFLGQVTELAAIYGWSWVHFRPARTAHGWRTPVSGPLGAGWPDLVLVRDRVIFAELKADDGRVRPEQAEVGAVLAAAGAEWHLWRPKDLLTLIVPTLSRRT